MGLTRTRTPFEVNTFLQAKSEEHQGNTKRTPFRCKPKRTPFPASARPTNTFLSKHHAHKYLIGTCLPWHQEHLKVAMISQASWSRPARNRISANSNGGWHLRKDQGVTMTQSTYRRDTISAFLITNVQQDEIASTLLFWYMFMTMARIFHHRVMNSFVQRKAFTTMARMFHRQRKLPVIFDCKARV